MIHVVGGVYRESCMHPVWQEVYGSGGRAASAIKAIGGDVTLHTYLYSGDAETLRARAAWEAFKLEVIEVHDCVRFSYYHTLSSPAIQVPVQENAPIRLAEEKVIRFGMVEGDAVVDAEYAVYDPQNAGTPITFHANGSRAKYLAVVLNGHEAEVMSGLRAATPETMAAMIAERSGAAVVIIKMGAKGALVYEDKKSSFVPAFQTSRVWKLGSGDNFVAHFGYHWMEMGVSAIEAAELASKATAYYCSNRGFISAKQLAELPFLEIRPSDRFIKGYQPIIYLAGPFFTLAELWLIEQARDNLKEIGLRVFSPYHDVGHGSAGDVVEIDLKAIRDCDVVLAVGDGLDSGTMYEVGYARAMGKPVVFYSENEPDSDKKMMLGSGCLMCDDYVTSIYRTLWAATEL